MNSNQEMNMDEDYQVWFEKLREIAAADGCPIEDCESWREMFADGITPEKAYREDLDAGCSG